MSALKQRRLEELANGTLTKVCKHHGNLPIEKMEISSRGIIVCRFCRSESKSRSLQKRLEELANGTLTKICKRHGPIPIDRIRINSRGELLCRTCCNDIKKASRLRDPEGFKKKRAEWFHSDIERKKRYRANDRPKRLIRQKKLNAKWKLIPEWRKKKDESAARSRKKASENLTDTYIKTQVRNFSIGGAKNRKRMYLKGIEVPQEIIELKRLQITLNRKIRENRKQKK